MREERDLLSHRSRHRAEPALSTHGDKKPDMKSRFFVLIDTIFGAPRTRINTVRDTVLRQPRTVLLKQLWYGAVGEGLVITASS